jgi:hypothetical protein
VFAEEAALFFLSPPFSEGWIRFELSASNATTGCADATDSGSGTDCEVEGEDVNDSQVATPADLYVPASIGAVFTMGAEHLSVSPFTYNNQDPD